MGSKVYYVRHSEKLLPSRAVARSENPGRLVVLGGDNVPPLVEIRLIDQSKTGGAEAPQPSRLRQPCIRVEMKKIFTELHLSFPLK